MDGNEKASYAVRAYATKISADPKQAWRSLLEDASLPPKAWLDAARASLERGDVDEARRLHKMHASKRAERARSSSDAGAAQGGVGRGTAWLVFERDAGSLADFDAAYAKAEAWGVFDGAAAAARRARARVAQARARGGARGGGPVAKRAKRRAGARGRGASRARSPRRRPRARRRSRRQRPRRRRPSARSGSHARGAGCGGGARGGAAPAPGGARGGAARPSNPPPPKKGPSDDARRLARTAFLVGLKSDATEDELRAAFEGCGAVAQTRVLKDKRSGQPTGKGFVEFVEDGDARAKALKLGKEQRKALGGAAPCKIFASKYACPDRPAAPPPKSRGRPQDRSCRAFCEGRSRAAGRGGSASARMLLLLLLRPLFLKGGHSQDAFRAMFLQGEGPCGGACRVLSLNMRV